MIISIRDLAYFLLKKKVAGIFFLYNFFIFISSIVLIILQADIQAELWIILISLANSILGITSLVVQKTLIYVLFEIFELLIMAYSIFLLIFYESLCKNRDCGDLDQLYSQHDLINREELLIICICIHTPNIVLGYLVYRQNTKIKLKN